MTGKKNLRFPLLFVPIFAVLLSACGGGESTPIPTLMPTVAPTVAPTTMPEPKAANATSEPETVTPPALSAEVSPLSAPASPLPTPSAKPETSATTGAIVGRIVLDRPEGEVYVSDMIMGLAEVIRDETGQPRVGGYEPSAAPKTMTDPTGYFVLSNLKPGTYTLILDAVVLQYQLANEATGETIMVDVKPGEVSELGTLTYTSLPVPGFK